MPREDRIPWWRRVQELVSSRVGLSTAHLAVLTIGALVAVVATAWYVVGSNSVPSQALADPPPPDVATAPAAPTPSAPPTTPASIRVHVIGAVRSPGVVDLTAGSRVADALDAAGGLTTSARPGELNLAQVLADGEQIWVGDAATPGGEVRTPTGGATSPGATSGGNSGAMLVNINTATVAELDVLPGVGPATAQRIVDHREAHGPFTSIDQLIDVSGIGAKTLERLRDLVTV